MPALRKRRVGPVDTMWLNMDRPNNLMVIEALLLLDGVPDWDEVIELFRQQVLEQFPVFRQRPEQPGLMGQPWWIEDEDFSLDRHIIRVDLPEPGDDATLQSHMEQELDRPLDRDHPLWRVHLISGYGSGSAIFLRIHHSLGDGIALTRVLLSLTKGEPDATTEIAVTTEVRPDESLADAADANGTGVIEDLAGFVGSGLQLARDGVAQLLRLATPDGAMAATREVGRTTQVLGDLLFSHNPDTPLSGAPGGAKRIRWSGPLPLADAKQLGRLAGATLNDVLMSAVAAALHRYQLDNGQEPVDLITMVPVNIRPLDEPLSPELGNAFALVLFRFPSGVSAPLARLAETKRRMDRIKRSPEAVITFAIINAIGHLSANVARIFVDFFANKTIGVTTNVAGPRSSRTLAGVPVSGILGWVPGSGRQTLGVCIFTYAGTVRVGFISDAAVIPDPERLLEAFENEVEHIIHMGRPLPRSGRKRRADR